MAKSFEVEIVVREESSHAQALAATKLGDPARRVGLRLTGQAAV